MKAELFHRWLNQTGQLTPSQLEQARLKLAQQFQVAETTVLLSELTPACPHCHHEQVIRWGSSCGLPRYRCRACKRTFNPLTTSPLAHLHHRDRWAEYARALITGLSVRKAALHCGVHKDTAFRWRHRFLRLPTLDEPGHLEGIVEADETYFLESFKGARQLPRQARKRGGKAARRGLSAEQIPVLIARDRHRTTLDAVLPQASSQAIIEVLAPVISQDAILCSDSSALYPPLARKAEVAHHPVNLSAGIRAQGPFHIQNVNAYDSRLKTWMRRFNGVATKYLPNYLGWRRCLERFGEDLSPQLMLAQALGQCQQ